MIDEDLQKNQIKNKLNNPQQSIRIVEVFPAKYEYLDQIREYVGRQAEISGMDQDKVYEIQLAVDEAVTNIIEHAYGGECKDDIQCLCESNQGSLSITLIDCGLPFNPSEVPEPDLSSSLEERKIGGLGIYFIKKMMDEVHYSFKPSHSSEIGNNILRMVKYK